VSELLNHWCTILTGTHVQIRCRIIFKCRAVFGNMRRNQNVCYGYLAGSFSLGCGRIIFFCHIAGCRHCLVYHIEAPARWCIYRYLGGHRSRCCRSGVSKCSCRHECQRQRYRHGDDHYFRKFSHFNLPFTSFFYNLYLTRSRRLFYRRLHGKL